MNNRPLSKEYIGKRLLISDYSVTCSELIEAGILEVSPSGEYAKIQIRKVDNTTYTKWCHTHDYVVLEELGSVMDQISDVVEKFNKDLKETERKAREEFHKHSTVPYKPVEMPTYTPPPYKTGDFWEHQPTSICSSDYADAPDWNATNYSAEVKKQKWVQGMCNPPSPDWKKGEEKEYVKNNTSTGRKYNSVAEMLKDLQ